MSRRVSDERAAALSELVEVMGAGRRSPGVTILDAVAELLADRATDAATIADLRAEVDMLRAALTEADYEQAKLRARLFAKETSNG